jgi:hypothetical protein
MINAKQVSLGQFLLGLAVALGGAVATVWTLAERAGEIQADVASLKTDMRDVKSALGIPTKPTVATVETAKVGD